MGKQKSLRSKAVHFVSDLTTVLLNPISDSPKPSSKHPPPSPENVADSEESQLESIDEESSEDIVDGPDTSSFTAFLYSFLSSSELGDDSKPGDDSNAEGKTDNQPDDEVSSNPPTRESGSRRGLLARGRRSLGRAISGASRLVGYRSQERKAGSDVKSDEEESRFSGVEMRHLQKEEDPVGPDVLPDSSEPSLLLSDKARSALYASLPALVQGRKWLLLYSTWRHGISLSTLYRRSMLWPGLSLLVIGDKQGAVFGGLVEAPLKPTNKRKYQGTNNTFVFMDTPGSPVIFRPTGANRYYTLCSSDYLAIGGGGHFAIYLDGDLSSGSSSVSDTYGNPCLAHSSDFEVKEVELWGFVYGSKYEEVLALSRTEMPGICRW